MGTSSIDLPNPAVSAAVRQGHYTGEGGMEGDNPPVQCRHFGTGGCQPVLCQRACNGLAAQHAMGVRHSVEQLQEAAKVPQGSEGGRRDHQVEALIGLEGDVLQVAGVAVGHCEWPPLHHRLCMSAARLHADKELPAFVGSLCKCAIHGFSLSALAPGGVRQKGGWGRWLEESP